MLAEMKTFSCQIFCYHLKLIGNAFLMFPTDLSLNENPVNWSEIFTLMALYIIYFNTVVKAVA